MVTVVTLKAFFLFLISAFSRFGNFELGDLKSHLMNIYIYIYYFYQSDVAIENVKIVENSQTPNTVAR